MDLAEGLSVPLQPHAEAFERYGKQYGVDPHLLASISEHETGRGTSKAFREGQNAMGVSDSNGPISFADGGGVDESIEHMAKMIGKSPVYAPARQAGTIDALGKIYAPVGAGNDPRGLNSSWSQGVTNFYNRLKDPGQKVSLPLENHDAVNASLKAVPMNPDSASQIDNLSKQYEVPFNVAMNGKEDLQKNLDAANLSKQIYRQNDDGSLTHPETAQHLSDPVNLAKSKDDVSALQNIEETIKNLPRVHDYQNSDPVASGEAVEAFPHSDANRVTDERSGFFQNLTGAVRDTAQSRDLGLKIANNVTDQESIVQAAMANRDKGQSVSQPGAAGFLGRAVGGFIEPGALGLVPYAGIALAGGDLVASGAGAAYQTVFNQELDKGSTPDQAHEKAMTAAGYGALINAALAATIPGAGKLAGRFAGLKAELSPTLGQAAKFVGYDAALQSGAGVVGSVATNLAEGKPAAEGSGEAAAQQALFSVLHLPMLIAAAHNAALPDSTRAISESVLNIQKAQSHIESLDSLKKVVTESKTAKRDPATVSDFMQANLEKNDLPTSVPMDAQALSQVFFQDAKTPEQAQQAKANLDTFLKDVAVDPKDFENAKNSASDVEINKAPLVAKYGEHPVFEAIKKDVSEGMETEKANLQENLKAMQREFEDMRQEHTLPDALKQAYAKMTMDVKSGGLGWSADEAKKNLALVHAFARNRARQTGETAEQFLARNPLELKSGEEAKQFFNRLTAQDLAATASSDSLKYELSKASGVPTETNLGSKSGETENSRPSLTPKPETGLPLSSKETLKTESLNLKYVADTQGKDRTIPVRSQAELNQIEPKELNPVQRPIMKKMGLNEKQIMKFVQDKDIGGAFMRKLAAAVMDGHLTTEEAASELRGHFDEKYPVEGSGLSREEEDRLSRQARIEDEKNLKDSMERVISFREALVKSKLPSLSALKKMGETLTTEYKMALENKKHVGVFRNDGVKLDEARQNLASFGYKFQTVDDMINAIDMFGRTGKDPSWSGYEGEGSNFRQDNRGAFVALKDGRRVIGLMEHADMSTFAHEFSHYAIDVLQKEIEAGNAGEGAKRDLHIMAETAGVKDGVWKREHHEFIAQSFEKYLMEGNAPSVELAGPFARFKSWLLDIYKSATGLGVKVAPELSGAFDRMLASQKEIKEAQDYYGLKNNIIDLITKDNAERAKLNEKRQGMTQEQEDRKVAQAMSTYFKVIKGRGDLEAKAAEAIDNSSFEKMMKDSEQSGISFEDLRKTLGDNDANELAVKYPKTIRRDGTKSIEELALEHGFETPDDLLKSMKELPDREERVRQETENLIKQKEEEVRKGIRAGVTGADEEVHGDKTLAYLLAETKALADQLNFKQAGKTYRLTVQAYRDAAREYILGQPVGDATRYDLYAAAERKYSRQFVKLIQQGKKEEAFTARSKQLLNHALVLESIKTREEVSKVQARYTPKNLASALKGIEHSYVDPTLEVLSRYGLTDKKPTQPFDLANIKTLDDGGGLDALMPEFVRNGVSKGDYRKTLTVDQLRDLHDFAQSMIHFGKDEMKSLQGKELQRLTDFVGRRIDSMSKLNDKKVAQEGEKLQGIRGQWERLKASVIQVQFLAQMIDGFSKRTEGKMGDMEKLYQSMIDAQLKEKGWQKEMGKALTPHMENFEAARKRIEGERGQYFDIEGVPVPHEWYALGRGKWTVERAISFLLNTGNEGNLKALKKGYNFNESHIQAVSKIFQESELKSIQGVWNAIDKLYPELNKTHFSIYNREVPKVKGSEITHTSSEGHSVKLDGGYYPLKFDSGMDPKAQGFQEINDLQRMKGVIRSAKAEDGMTKGRVGGMMPPQLSFDVLSRHLSDTIHYITHSDPLRDWSRVTIDPAFRKTFIDKFGTENFNDMRTWIKDQANVAPPTSNSEFGKVIDDWFNKTRSLATVGAFGANLKSAVLIRHSLLNAAHVLGWDWMSNGYRNQNVLTSVLGMTNTDSWKRIADMSPYMAKYHESIEREFREMQTDVKPGGAAGKLDSLLRSASAKFGKEITLKDARDASMSLITASHRAVVSVVWQGAFNKYVQTIADRALPHDEQVKQGIKYADSLVQDTQPSSLKAEMNALQRETGLARVFTAFMSWNFKYGGRLQFENRAWQEGKISTAQYSSHIAHEVIAPAVVRMGLIGAMTASVPTGWDWAKASFESLFSWIPVFNHAPDFVNRHGNVDVGQGLEGEIPQSQGLMKGAKAINTTAGFMNDKKSAAQFAWDWARAAEYYSGVNVSNTAKQIYTFFSNIGTDEKQ